MSKITSILLAIVFSSKALADCSPVTPIEAGEVAPCPGFIFSPAKELELRQKNEDYKLLLEQVKIYQQQKDLFKQQLDISDKIVAKEEQKAEIWRTQAEASTQKLIETQERQGTRDWVFLVSGIVLTVAAGYAVGQAHK